jgi:hypothetical protein
LIIGISAKAGSGKTEFAKIAKEEFGAQIISFAGTLKEEVMHFLQENNLQFRLDNIFGKQIDREELIFIPLTCLLEDQIVFKNYGITNNNTLEISFRTLLQIWGTEYRRAQDENYWVKRALEKCKPITFFGEHEWKHDLFVIDDLRFENEADALLDVDAKLVRVERPNNPNPISNPWHESETGLDHWNLWHYILENDCPLEEYHEGCRIILRELLDER